MFTAARRLYHVPTRSGGVPRHTPTTPLLIPPPASAPPPPSASFSFPSPRHAVHQCTPHTHTHTHTHTHEAAALLVVVVLPRRHVPVRPLARPPPPSRPPHMALACTQPQTVDSSAQPAPASGCRQTPQSRHPGAGPPATEILPLPRAGCYPRAQGASPPTANVRQLSDWQAEPALSLFRGLR